jgi:hypothetical protein
MSECWVPVAGHEGRYDARRPEKKRLRSPMDISDTLAPNSDQLDAVDLLGGPRTFTITKVSKGNPEQPVDVHLAEFPRVWRPGKSMRRVLVACWGPDASAYVGRRVTLYCDGSVRFGADLVGGTRIAALSHIDKPKSVPLLVSRGKSAMYRVEPLPDYAPVSPAVDAETLAELTALFEEAQIPEDRRLAGANQIIRGAATALEVLTEDQARTVLASLKKKVGR